MATMEPPAKPVQDPQQWTSTVRNMFLEPMQNINNSVRIAWNTLADDLRPRKNQDKIRTQFDEFDKPISFHSSLYRLIVDPNDQVKSSVIAELEYEATFMVFAKFEAVRKCLVQIDDIRRVIEDIFSAASDTSRQLRAESHVEEERASSIAAEDKQKVCDQLNQAVHQLGNILGMTERLHAEIWICHNNPRAVKDSIAGNTLNKMCLSEVLSQQSLSQNELLHVLREGRLRLALNCAQPLWSLEGDVDVQSRKTLELMQMLLLNGSVADGGAGVNRSGVEVAAQDSHLEDVEMAGASSESVVTASTQQSQAELARDIVERLRLNSGVVQSR